MDTAAIPASFLDQDIRTTQPDQEQGLGPGLGSGLGLGSASGLGSGQGSGIEMGDGDGKGSYCSDDIFNRRDMW